MLGFSLRRIMESFLRKSKTIRVDGVDKLHVVIGNESCDLDSATCALSYSYFLHQTQPAHIPPHSVHLPVLNILRKEYPYRMDVKYLLDKHGLTSDLLTFRDDLDLSQFHRAGKLSFTLVDFNRAPDRDRGMDAAIIEILDHHVVTEKHADNVLIHVEMVGSCATLVAERLLAASQHVWPPEVIDLLYNAILADTICLEPSAGRTTPSDEKVVKAFEALKHIDSLETRRRIFDELSRIKQDVSGLPTPDLLRKDLKCVSSVSDNSNTGHPQSIAISSIMENLQVFLRRPQVMQDISELGQSERAVAVVLTFLQVNSQNITTRQLAVYSPYTDVQKQLCDAFLGSTQPSLELASVSTDPHEHILAYEQGNVSASRKVILPLVVNAMKTMTTAS